MYKKINQEENYAPIFMDSGVYIATQGSLSGGKSVTFHILDWNMNPTIYTYTDTGYNNNMYNWQSCCFPWILNCFSGCIWMEKMP